MKCYQWSIVIFGLWVMPVHTAFADDCSNYPLADGISVKQTANGPKIMSTATVTVIADDSEEIIDANKDAELSAKAAISKFFNETIQSEESLSKVVETQLSVVGENKEATKKTLKTQLTSIRNKSESLLSGVRRIGDCYTKGKLVKVTLAKTISNAEFEQESGGSSGGGTSGGLTPMDSYSNTKDLQ